MAWCLHLSARSAMLVTARFLACYALEATLSVSGQGLTASNVALVINAADPVSVATGRYYAQRRGIPSSHVASVSFGYRRGYLSAVEFAAIKAAVDAQVPANIQAYVLTWVRPYRVECMSITTAFAFGFDRAFCASGCASTRLSPYFDADAEQPFTALGVRPAMSIAGNTSAETRALIDRGIASDGSQPGGTAYFVISNDDRRNVRALEYPDAISQALGRIKFQLLRTDAVRNKQDVLFYFVGESQVAAIDSNSFVPGAIADHLTSFGGVLDSEHQMSSLRWLQAGATGSFGTVVEPCNFNAKFPNPAVLLRHYMAGETLMEAYWKSVAMPGQGLFIGEPLASPFSKRPH